MNSNSGSPRVDDEFVFEGRCTKITVGPLSTSRGKSSITTTSVNSVTDLTRHFTHGPRDTQNNQRERQQQHRQQVPHKDLVFTRLPPMRTTTRILSPLFERRRETKEKQINNTRDKSLPVSCEETTPEQVVGGATGLQRIVVPSKTTLANSMQELSPNSMQELSHGKRRSTTGHNTRFRCEENVSESFYAAGKYEFRKDDENFNTSDIEGKQTSESLQMEEFNRSTDWKPKNVLKKINYYDSKGYNANVKNDDLFVYNEVGHQYKCDEDELECNVTNCSVPQNPNFSPQRKAETNFTAASHENQPSKPTNWKTSDVTSLKPGSESSHGPSLMSPTSFVPQQAPYDNGRNNLPFFNNNSSLSTFSVGPLIGPRNMIMSAMPTLNSVSAANIHSLGMYSLDNIMPFVNPVSPSNTLFVYPNTNTTNDSHVQPDHLSTNNPPRYYNVNNSLSNRYNSPLVSSVNGFLPNSVMPMHYYDYLSNIHPATYLENLKTHPLVSNNAGALTNPCTDASRDTFGTSVLPQNVTAEFTDVFASDPILNNGLSFNDASVAQTSSLSSNLTRQDGSKLIQNGPSTDFKHRGYLKDEYDNVQSKQKQYCSGEARQQEDINGRGNTSIRTNKNCELRDAFTSMEKDVDLTNNKPQPRPALDNIRSSISCEPAHTTMGHSRSLSNSTETREKLVSCGQVVGDRINSSWMEPTLKNPSVTDTAIFPLNASPQEADLPEIDYICLESPVSDSFNNKEQLTGDHQHDNILHQIRTMSRQACGDKPHRAFEKFKDSRFEQTLRTHSYVTENTAIKQTGDVRISPLPQDNKRGNTDEGEAPLVVYKGDPRLLAAIQRSSSDCKEARISPSTISMTHQACSVSPCLPNSTEDNISVMSRSRSDVCTLKHADYRRDHVTSDSNSFPSFVYYTGMGTYSTVIRPTHHTGASPVFYRGPKPRQDGRTKNKKVLKKRDDTSRSYSSDMLVHDEFTRYDGFPSDMKHNHTIQSKSKYSSLSKIFSKLHFGNKKTSKQNGGHQMSFNKSVKSLDPNFIPPTGNTVHDKQFYSFRYSDCQYGTMSASHRDRGEEHNFFMYNLDRLNTFNTDHDKSKAPSVRSCYTVL